MQSMQPVHVLASCRRRENTLQFMRVFLLSGASEELSTRTDQRTKKAGANPRGGREGYELRCHFLLQLGGVTRKHDVGRTSEREAEVKVLSNPTSPIFHSFRPGEHTFTNARTSFSQTQKPVLLIKRYHQDRRHVASQP
jgi:hypothetical protein